MSAVGGFYNPNIPTRSHGSVKYSEIENKGSRIVRYRSTRVEDLNVDLNRLRDSPFQ